MARPFQWVWLISRRDCARADGRTPVRAAAASQMRRRRPGFTSFAKKGPAAAAAGSELGVSYPGGSDARQCIRTNAAVSPSWGPGNPVL